MYNSFKDTIAEAYQQVELFNEIASNLDNVTIDSLDNQLSFVFEELVETIDALESKDDKLMGWQTSLLQWRGCCRRVRKLDTMCQTLFVL